MAHEFIYTCYKLARHYPPDRTVLENISLSFYPGAKIGVIGSNGSGKSSLLRIMAGLDDGFSGDARLTPVSLQDRSKNGGTSPDSRRDKPARLQAGPGCHLASGLEGRRRIDVSQTSQCTLPAPPQACRRG